MENYAKIADTGKRRIVIVGGGFGGLELAGSLQDADVQVVLIDKNNYHTFQPLLYQVATAGIDADSIVHPFRKIFEGQDNFYFRLATVEHVDTERQVVETSIGLIKYDFLVIATGATSNFFGNAQMEQNAISMKSVEDAMELRNTILYNFEKALQLDDCEQQNSLMDYVIVGGGPTGVELAGALSELRRHVFPKDYRELNFKEMDIYLIQSGPQLLKGMSEEASQKSLEYLQKFGVNVWLNRRVLSYDGYTVSLDTGEKLITRTLIWAAGVTGAPLQGLSKDSLLRGNRLQTDRYNRVAGYENIFAIGDVAAMVTEENPQGYPMLAQPAIQQGHLLGKNLQNLLAGKPLEAFTYNDQGSMATVGRNHAVADLKVFKKDLRTQGFMAWLIWVFIHLTSLVGFRNRMAILLDWIWSYFTYDTGNRLILGGKHVNIPVKETITHKAVE
ncbi:NAD(P)/FAD-dependent oxidoreductase [Pontibacter sp. 172403-2]|uniref:NAD(P)/FAD-dependent oxidoreductase n=1 Tax=Pontibacter rufus TaxID=2791028 RepID=UPI0018AFDCEC|nr:NAD(P)/FAD-dependent oxidoreductase [Pontibacter sp. 172403-2]MBF9254599.1 NAD(P)/FAD-dependent oxidoreductase [Pontibacter sp. 172403-2]